MNYFFACAAALYFFWSPISLLIKRLLQSDPVTILISFSIICASACGILTLFYISNILRFRSALKKIQTVGSGQPVEPPPIPYVFPWIGNAPSFLSTKPHHFWLSLFKWYPRAAGVCSLVLGGRLTTVLFDTTAIQQILQDRKLGREEFSVDVLHNGLGVTKEQCEEFYGFGKESKKGETAPYQEQEKYHTEYMMKAERVNELTAEFIRIFEQRISTQFTNTSVEHEVTLYKWLRTLMFDASTTSLLGSKILEVSPDLEKLFFQFDADMLSLFFGIPSLFISKAISNRREIVGRFRNWHKIVRGELGTTVIDPDEVAWEPLYGSRINRARQALYERHGLSMMTRSALDLGLLFGIASNAIPASHWMLMHILHSNRPGERVVGEKCLYNYVMDEINASKGPDGTIDVSVLVTQPILLSTLHEVLRVYVDTLVGRTISQDMTVALGGHPSKSDSKHNRSLTLTRGTYLLVPSYPAHTGKEAWQSTYPDHPPPDQFYPYRFLITSPQKVNATPVFSTAHTSGTFFPFGGGKFTCPGRNFAKQEILGGVAIALTTFEFEFVSYVDADGRKTNTFPGLRDTFPGSAVMCAAGDMKLKVKRRQRL